MNAFKGYSAGSSGQNAIAAFLDYPVGEGGQSTNQNFLANLISKSDSRTPTYERDIQNTEPFDWATIFNFLQGNQ